MERHSLNIELRTYERSSHLEEVRGLIDRAMRHLSGHLHSLESLDRHQAHTRTEAFAGDLDSITYMVATSEDGSILGCGGWSFDPDQQTARIREVYVEPDFSRRGVATLLVRESLRQAQASAVKRIWVTASIVAVPLYQRLGFAAVAPATDSDLPSVEMEWTGDVLEVGGTVHSNNGDVV